MVDRSEHNRKLRWKAVQSVLMAYRKGSPLQPIAPSEKPQLSFGQERLWFLSQLGGDNTVYNLPFAFWMEGDLDVTVLEKSLQEILRRHDILRTTFPCVAAQPAPVIAPICNNLQLSVTDLRLLAPAQQETRYQRISQNEISRPFDLAQGPLWRFQLLRVEEQKYVLLMTIHHIIYDGWSQSVFTKELSTLYQDFSTGQPSSLPNLPIQYADFAHWQRQWLTGEILQSQRSYWQQQLAGDLPSLHLPFEQAVQTDVHRMTYKGDRHPVEFSPEVTAELQKLAERQGVTLFVVILAAFNLLLYQYTKQENIIICSTQAGRNLSKIQGLIGFFNTVVPLRTNLYGNPSFLEVLDRTNQVVLDGYQYQDMPLQLLVNAQNLAHKRLYQVMFVLQNTPSEVVTLPGIQVKSQFLSNGTANFDLFLSLISPEYPAARLTGYLEYKTDLFTTSAIGKLLADFKELLANLVENPHQKLSNLPLLVTEKQRSPVANLTEKSTEPYVAPRTPIEQQLAEIWSEVLGQERISIYDNFFRLGGYSLLATQVISRVNTAFGAEFPILPIFQHPTIAALAEAIEACLQDQPGMTFVKIEPVRRENKLPLSFAQQQLWFLDRFGSTIAYNLPIALVFSGSLKVTALHQTLQEIVDRHESLRTTFSADDGIPYQVIHSRMAIDLPILDLSSYGPEEQEMEVKRLTAAEATCPFDLNHDPMLRVTLLHLGQSPFPLDHNTGFDWLAHQQRDRLDRSETHHILLLTLHHIAADGWSIDILLKELTVLYWAFSQDRPSPLTDLSIQYADFALWQRQWLQREILEAQLDYWKQQLLDAPALLELPTDRPRPAEQTYRGGYHYAALSLELSGKLSALSKRTGVTLFMTLLAAFVTLLYRITSSDDIVVGTPVAGRNRQEIEGLIGFFVNTLVLRTYLGGNPSFEDVLSRVREVAIGAYTHQDLPFEQLVDALQPKRDLSYTPLFHVMFALNEKSVPSFELPELTISSYSVEIGTAKFDLSLSMENTASGLIAGWEYNVDLFDETTIARMARHFQTLLEGIVANPQQRVSSLPLLTEPERCQLLWEWNNTTKEYPNDKCIHQLFEEQVERSPDAIAVVFEEEQLTYLELNQRANCLAHHLKTLGVGPEVLVGICVERSIEMVVAILGILKAGGAYIPLDPRYPKERLAYMMLDSSVPILLTQQKLLVELPVHSANVVCLDTGWGEIAGECQDNPVTNVQASNLAYTIYTSGSTGKPKGSLIEHQALVNYTLEIAKQFNLQAGDRFLQFAAIGFDVVVEELFPTWLSGAAVVLPKTMEPISCADLLQLIEKEKITVIELPTVYWHQLVNELSQTPGGAPNSLRLVIVGGETASPEKLATWQKFCIPMVHVYGLTETTVTSIVYHIPACAEKQEIWSNLPIGRPIANTQIYLLDSQKQPVPIGVIGEIYIGGVSLARGYLNRKDLTDEKFIPDPFSNKHGARLYKTGDLARYLPDGNIEFLGRIDNQVKIRGFRIELGEIEAALAQHPGVRETVVIVREDIQSDKRLVAYLVPDQALPTNSSLRHFLKQKLPDYMIPSAFVILDAIPLTPNGKVDRRALPTPDTARHELETDLVAPSTESEEILAKIWREVLHLEQVGIHDNFFELGGDSILSIQIIFKAKQAGLQLTAKQIFQHQTIAELAAVTNVTQTVRAEQGLVSGLLPLTPIQHWFFEQNLPEPHHFNQSFLLEVPQTLDPTLLSQVVQQLLVHHDALRLRFVQSDSDREQINTTPDDTIPFSHVDLVDLSAIPDTEQKAAIEAVAASLQASLNLSSGPLVRVAFFALGTDKANRLLIVIHHLAVDGVSWRILLEDLETAYQQISHGERIQLRPKTTSFKHWAEKLTNYAHSDTAKKELNYWQGISRTQINRLPVDNAFGANTAASAHTVSVSLSPEETHALLQKVPKTYKTQINDILLTALVQVLGKWTGSNSVLLDLEGHGREELFDDVDLLRTVGWFTTIFPVLLELKATDNLGDSLKSIKEQLRAVPNRGIGYGLLRYLSGDASIASLLSSTPQAEVSFNYLGQFDWGIQENSFFKLAPESVGSEQSQQGSCSYLLNINGLVVESQLQLHWTYSENFHSSATIESLAQDFAQALRILIAHCLSTDTGGYTPDVSDNQTIHGLAQPINNDQHQENKVPLTLHLLQLPEGTSELLPEDTESVYPIAKMQEFMLNYYCNNHQKMGVYHCQQSYDIYDESLNLNAFKKALEISVQKHPALRTIFIIQNGTPAVQVVKKNLRFSINEQDISHIKLEKQSNYIDAVMKQDRQNLFDVENPNEPLFRFVIFHKAENRFEFLMSIHHAIDDGWGHIEFLNELYEIYSVLKKGEEITVVPAANVYKEFVALEKEIIDSLDASNFWKLHLKNHTYKPLKPLTTSVEEVEDVTEKYNFEEEIITDVRELCRKLRVSPKALFLSTYLDLIGTVMKSNRVCVGIVSNGRTERLSDPFGALGLFWNMVPFCQSISSEKGVQIKNVQQSLIDMEPYVTYPLLEILSDQQKPELFFATFNFVSFHNAKNLKADTGLKVNWRKSHDKFNFPLNYAVSMSPVEGNVSLSVEYDKLYFSRQEIRSMVQNYIEILKHTVHLSELY